LFVNPDDDDLAVNDDTHDTVETLRIGSYDLALLADSDSSFGCRTHATHVHNQSKVDGWVAEYIG
jgi:hypothetical protein